MTSIQSFPPDGIFDPATRMPRFGTYARGLPSRVDLGPRSPLTRLRREKRWMYVFVASEEVAFAAAIIRLGFAANVFAFAVDRKSGAKLTDQKMLAPPFAARVGERPGPGHESWFLFPTARLLFRRPEGSDVYTMEVEMPNLSLEAELSTTSAPPALGVVVPLQEDKLFSTTEKRQLLSVKGSLEVGGRRFSLDNAFASYDYTAGLLERRTAWRWASAMGRAKDGRAIGLNLTKGFVDSRECVVWVDDQIHAVSPATFSFEPQDPYKPWKVGTEGGEVMLDFTPQLAHTEHNDLHIVRSSFVQVAGDFRGRIALPGKEVIEVDHLPGLTEDQDTLW